MFVYQRVPSCCFKRAGISHRSPSHGRGTMQHHWRLGPTVTLEGMMKTAWLKQCVVFEL